MNLSLPPPPAPSSPKQPKPADADTLLLATLFAEAVGAESIEPDESFLTIGGRGKAAIFLINRIREVFGVEATSRLLFAHLTPRRLAPALRALPTAREFRCDGFDIRFVRGARYPARSLGTILCMPQHDGTDAYATTVSATILQDFDIWSCRFSVTAPDDSGHEDWVDRSFKLARWLTCDCPLPVTGLLGFCMGGHLAWLADRIRVADGRDPLPIVNIDSVPLAHYHEAIRTALAQRIGDAPQQTPSRMLLLYRPHYGGIDALVDCQACWAEFGVPVIPAPCRTIAHLDLIRYELLSVYEPAIVGFFVGKPTPIPLPPIDTPGGWMFELLALDAPPTTYEVSAALSKLPAGPIDDELMLAILWLSLATGDQAIAFGTIERILAQDPNYRNAVYAKVALLNELRRNDEAAAIARDWEARNHADPSIDERAKRRFRTDMAWKNRVGLYTDAEGLELALDVAASRVGAI
ncbi:MAG: acyl carrier protein [Rhodospirillales bacterium]